MRVLYLSTDPGIDLAGKSGGSIHIRAFVRALADLGHEVILVCSAATVEKSIEADLRAAVRCVPLARWNLAMARGLRHVNRRSGKPVRGHSDSVRTLHNLHFIRRAASAARELAPDFIYERYSLWGMAGLWLSRQLGTPLVLEVNAPLVYEQQQYRAGLTCPPLARWVERYVWQKADLMIAVSESLRNLIQSSGVSPKRIHVLPNAVDLQLFHTATDGKRLRKLLKLDDRFTIGFVGTFRPWHGVDFLIKAFQQIHQEDHSTHLLLVGEGPLRARLESLVHDSGLQEAVTFAGRVAHKDVPKYLAAMDVAIAPYPPLDEFYYSPIKLFEYMAAGRAVVASRLGQITQIVEDGVTGLLFEPGNLGSLVDCIERLRKDAALRSEIGERASAACSKHTWSHNAARVIDWAKPLINQNSAFVFPGEAERLAECYRGNSGSPSEGE